MGLAHEKKSYLQEKTIFLKLALLSKFLEYSVGIAEKYGSLSNGGLEEARDFVVDEIRRRKREALEEK